MNRRALVFWSRARLGFVAGFRPQRTYENASTRARLSRPILPRIETKSLCSPSAKGGRVTA